MKISIGFETAKMLFRNNIECAANEIKRAGFDGVDLEICETPLEQVLTNHWTEEMKRQANVVRNAGLEIAQCHLHYQPSHELLADGSYAAFEEAFLPVWIKEIQLCSEIGCPVAVVHMFFSDDPRKTLNGNMILLEKLLLILKKYKVTLAIENIYGWGEEYGDCGVTTAEQIMQYIEAFNSEYIGACLDPGHAVCTGNDAVQMAKCFGKNLKATHINSSSGRDTHLFPGTLPSWIDPTDFADLSRVLKEIGYTGTYNLEVSSGSYPNTPKIGKVYLEFAAQIAKSYAEIEKV